MVCRVLGQALQVRGMIRSQWIKDFTNGKVSAKPACPDLSVSTGETCRSEGRLHTSAAIPEQK